MSASNETPRLPKILLALGHAMAQGMTQLQATVGLHHHTDATMTARLIKIEGDPNADSGSAANKGSQLMFKDCETAVTAAIAACNALSDGAVKTWLGGARRVLIGVLGASASSAWEAAGFSVNSTAVPKSADERDTLLVALRAYFAAHPDHEATLPQPSGPPLTINAATALSLHTQLSAALALINTRETLQTQCKMVRDQDVADLYHEVSGAISELNDLLPGDDPRWETFGLNIPANPNPPEPVDEVTLTAAGAGREHAEWGHARRATYYRVFIKVIGTDTDFRFVDRTNDLEMLLKSLTAGTTIEVQVIAANEGGEAAPSPTVTKVVGA